MELSSVLIFSAIATLTVAIDYNYNSESCSYESNCIRLIQCTEFHKGIISAEGDAHRAYYFEKFRSLSCGFENFEPKVCCPKRKNSDYGDESRLLNVCGKDINRDYGNKAGLGDFPWLALLEYKTPNGGDFLCGGVLISDLYVLTSAKCVTSSTNTLTSVLLGKYDLSQTQDCIDEGDGTQTCANSFLKVDINRVIVHQNYEDLKHRDDQLTLIKLRNKIQFSSYIQPICLPINEPIKGHKVFVSGWGKSMNPRTTAFDIKHISRLTNDEEMCKSQYAHSFDAGKYLCAGDVRKSYENVCVADAGGPLMGYELKSDGTKRFTVFGVSSADRPCDINNIKFSSGRFSRVRNYISWIHEQIKDD